MYLDTSAFPLLPVLGCFLRYVLGCIFRGLSCHTENPASVLMVCEKKKRKYLFTSTTSSVPFSQLFGVSTLRGKKLKKVEKAEKTLCDFCLLHSVSFSSACPDSRDLSCYSLQSIFCLSLQMFAENLFLIQGKITAH